jgi:Exopolysaccharide biosynthesis protein YbjH
MFSNTSRPPSCSHEHTTHTARYSAVAWAVLVLSASTAASVTAGTPLPDTFQMAPAGYSGAIKTPTADVLPHGTAAISLTNDNPDMSPVKPISDPLGSINVGFGLLPGLELVGRLLFHGNLQCNTYLDECSSRRDLSLSGKYQLPVLLPYNTRLALGFTDFGGAEAATFFKQTYGVATSTFGPIDVSLGYSPKSSNKALDGKYNVELLNGLFGSATVRATDNWALIAEADSSSTRLGTHYTLPLRSDLDLQLGISRKTRGTEQRHSAQMTATLHYVLDKKIQESSRANQPAWQAAATTPSTATTLDQRALALSSRLAVNGFANIHIAALPAANGQPLLWWVQADPVGWRKDHQQAMGEGLVQWMLGQEADDTDVVLSLTYMGQPTTSVYTSRNCLNSFAMGQDNCGQNLALRFYSGQALPQRLENARNKTQNAPSAGQLDTLVSNAAPYAWKPQIELGANIRSTVGTEYGLTDYSAALDVGAQVQLSNVPALGEWGQGLMWQGNVLVPVARSEDFDKGNVFHRVGHTKTQVDQALLSHMRNVDTPLAKNVALQASVGAINPFSRGGQVDAVWVNPLGDWRVGGTLGVYSRNSAAGDSSTQTPALLSVRHSALAGQWQLEGTVGTFLSGDSGFKVASHHWFGDYRLSFFINDSKISTVTMPKRRFAGFQISLPLGAKGSTDMGWGNARGQDRLAWGGQTKIGDDINTLTLGYAEVPRPRHGVWTDITNNDRSGAVDMWANRYAMRAALQQDKP